MPRDNRDRRDYMREYAAQRRRRDRRFVASERARQRLGYAVRKGWIVRQPCCICGDEEKPVEAHQPARGFPYSVAWCCHACAERHAHHPTVETIVAIQGAIAEQLPEALAAVAARGVLAPGRTGRPRIR